ncbi:MAG: DUF3558 family protein [Pseudonocardia sp.]|nr:DUF3558 family protein [Pseudonocardia sp.]
MGMRGRAAVRLMLLLPVLSGTALVGCGTEPSRLAPPIPDEQLDLAEFVSRPCDLLRADRVARRHLAVPGTTMPGPVGSVCRWSAVEAGRPTIMAGASVNRSLESLYQQRSSFTFFEPTEISHYPAVHTTTAGRDPASGICSTQVGVGDSALLTVTAEYAGGKSLSSSDPCPDTDTFANEIISQIRAANP